MNYFLEGIGKVLGKIADNTMGRIERLKNEKVRLEEEHGKLLSKGKLSTADRVRVINIDRRLSEIKSILANKASD